VSRDPAGRYFVSCLVEAEAEIAPLPAVEACGGGAGGSDVGLHAMVALVALVVLETGEQVGNPHFFRQDEAKLASRSTAAGQEATRFASS